MEFLLVLGCLCVLGYLLVGYRSQRQIRKSNPRQVLEQVSLSPELEQMCDSETKGYKLFSALKELPRREIDLVINRHFTIDGRPSHWMDTGSHASDPENITSFPTKSYYSIVPDGIDQRNVLYGSYTMQDYLWKHQHPRNCSEKRFFVVKKRASGAGHGAEMNWMSVLFSQAVREERIVIFDPAHKWRWANGSYCGSDQSNDCFYQPITHCMLSEKEMKEAVTWNGQQTQNTRIVSTSGDWHDYSFPAYVTQFMKSHNLSEASITHYWFTQTSTYLFRPNERTMEEVKRFQIADNGRPSVSDQCVHIWVRHGDKGSEMELIEAKEYLHAVDFLNRSSFFPKGLFIYLSTDDPTVIDYFKSTEYLVRYTEFPRFNGNYNQNLALGDQTTLQIIADTINSIQCDAFIGTMRSQISKQVNYLRSTTGFKSDSIFIDNGLYNCLSAKNCSKMPFLIW